MNKGRLEAFTDGVIVIVLTLLILNIKSPDSPSIKELLNIRISLIAYILSFIFIVVIWRCHHQLLAISKKINTASVWANIFWLFWLTLSPFVTSWISKFPTNIWPALSYSLVFFMWSLSYALLSNTLANANGENSEVFHMVKNDNRSNYSLIINIILVIGIFFWPPIALIGRFLVSLIWIPSYKKFKELT